MTPEEKALAVLQLEVAVDVDVVRLGGELEKVLRRDLVQLTGDLARDVASLDVQVEPEQGAFRIRGFGPEGVQRVDALGALAPDDHGVVDVVLVVTKGSRVANLETQPIWGVSGLDIGNPLLVTRLLDAAIPVLVRAGVTTIRNDPFDARVREIYVRMGFRDGEVLDLRDPAALRMTFADAASVAAAAGLSLCELPA